MTLILCFDLRVWEEIYEEAEGQSIKKTQHMWENFVKNVHIMYRVTEYEHRKKKHLVRGHDVLTKSEL